MRKRLQAVGIWIVWIGGLATGVQYLIYGATAGVAFLLAAFAFLIGETPFEFRAAIFVGLFLIFFVVLNHLLGLLLARRRGRSSPRPPDPDELEQLKARLAETEQERDSRDASIEGLRERLGEWEGDRRRFKAFLDDAWREGLNLSGSKPSKEVAREWESRVRHLLKQAIGEEIAEKVLSHDSYYQSGNFDATDAQKFMEMRLHKMERLKNNVAKHAAIPIRSGFDPYGWKDWKTPPGDELRRRCAELAKELTKFLDAWESYRDQPKIYPEKPGDWPKYTMEQYRPKFEQRLATLLDDLEQRGWLTPEARAHFEVPTHNPQAIRKVVARLSSICQRD